MEEKIICSEIYTTLNGYGSTKLVAVLVGDATDRAAKLYGPTVSVWTKTVKVNLDKQKYQDNDGFKGYGGFGL